MDWEQPLVAVLLLGMLLAWVFVLSRGHGGG